MKTKLNTFLSHPFLSRFIKSPLKTNIKVADNTALKKNVENLKAIDMVDDSGIPLVSLKVNGDVIELTLHKPIILNTSGDFNWVNKGNIHIESHKGDLHLNSRLAKQIKDLPESILFRYNQWIKKISAKDNSDSEILSAKKTAMPTDEE